MDSDVVYGNLTIANPLLGCESIVDESEKERLEGKVVIVERGVCFFTVKVLNLQRAGAAAVIIANNDLQRPYDALPPRIDGLEQPVTIPVFMLTNAQSSNLMHTIRHVAARNKLQLFSSSNAESSSVDASVTHSDMLSTFIPISLVRKRYDLHARIPLSTVDNSISIRNRYIKVLHYEADTMIVKSGIGWHASLQKVPLSIMGANNNVNGNVKQSGQDEVSAMMIRVF
jgi:hypothetical protein